MSLLIFVKLFMKHAKTCGFDAPNLIPKGRDKAALSMRQAQLRLRSPTRSRVCSASAINCTGRLVIYHEWRSPED